MHPAQHCYHSEIVSKVSLILVSIYVLVFANAAPTRMQLPDELKLSLQSALSTAFQLQSVLAKAEQEPFLTGTMRALQQTLSVLNANRSLIRNEATHLQKILESTKLHLEKAQMMDGQLKKDSLTEAFRQLAQVPKAFDVGSHQVYFCRSDRSVWLHTQSASKSFVHPYLRAGKGCQRIFQ